jgi:argininosuccinate synthase
MKIVLAYSGGLDTSVLLSWIKETYGNAEMICFCANVGQEDELKGLNAKAKKTGASKIYIDDLQEEFAKDFIYPILRAGAIYEGQYFLGTSIARPLIAKRMVEIAKAEGAHAIAHGATGKGNDQVRFELTAAALGDHRPVARRPVPRPVPRAPGDDRLLRRQEDPRPGQRQEAVFDGPQPSAHFLRGRHPRRPVV